MAEMVSTHSGSLLSVPIQRILICLGLLTIAVSINDACIFEPSCYCDAIFADLNMAKALNGSDPISSIDGCYSTCAAKNPSFCALRIWLLGIGSMDVLYGNAEGVGDDWRAQLLDGVNTLFVPRPLGTLEAVGPLVQPIMSLGGDQKHVIMTAASWGRGRVIAFSTNLLVDHFTSWSEDEATTVPDYGRLFRNILDWHNSQGSKSQFFVQAQKDNWLDVSSMTSLSITQVISKGALIWTNLHRKDEAFTKMVSDYVQNGGLLIAGADVTSLNVKDYRPAVTGGLGKVLADVGILFRSSRANTSIAAVQENQASKSHLRQVLADAIADPSSVPDFRTIRKKVTDVLIQDTVWNDCILSALRNAYKKAAETKRVIPNPRRPLADPVAKMAIIFLELANRFTPEDQELMEMPATKVFPGQPESSLEDKVTTVTLEINTPVKGWYSTGYYAPPGQTITVKVRSEVRQTWSITIGAHMDDISDRRKEWKRYPQVSEKHDIKRHKREFRLRNSFGGMIYLENWRKSPWSITLELAGVVEAPAVNIYVDSSLQDWDRRQQSPVPWVDYIGQYVTMSIPLKAIHHMDPTKVIKHYDELLVHYHELKGTDIMTAERQWMVYDAETSAGYLHSGYPVVGGVIDSMTQFPKLDVHFSDEKLLELGNWGWYHEFGHNMQDNSWKLPNEGEITVNIFSIYGYTKMFEKSEDLLAPRKKQAFDEGILFRFHGCEGKKFSDRSAWAGLAVHWQLIDNFGFEAYRRVLRQYNEMTTTEIPITDQSRIDEWVTRFSRVVGHNITPLYRFWCWPVSEIVANSLSTMPPWFPEDRISQFFEKELPAMEAEYPGLVRKVEKLVQFVKFREPVGFQVPFVNVK